MIIIAYDTNGNVADENLCSDNADSISDALSPESI